jgi:PAS domain S-box-containing protein
MKSGNGSLINIGVVGGGPFCREVLEKMVMDYAQEQISARFRAVADPEPNSPGMVFAREIGLETRSDYHDLYAPELDIQLIIIMDPDEAILKDVLDTKPESIRVLAYAVFNLFWKAISVHEGRLRQRATEMETILNGIQDFILVITPDRDIVDVNEPFLRQMGYSRDQVIGRKCHEVYQNLEQECNFGDLICPLNEVVRNQRPSQHLLSRVNRRGEKRYVELTIYPIWERDGKISKFIEISRDITDRKREEEEITRRLEQMVEERTRQLQETHAKLLHKDKMASLGKLSSSVVHEINNPIAGILNLILLEKRMIQEGDMGPTHMETFNRYLDLMETETRRISRIVSNLLAFSRQSKMEVKSLDLNRLVEKTLILNANLLKIHGIHVDKRLEPKLASVVGSEDQLQQVLMNLVSNAAEAMDHTGNGTLTVETQNGPDGRSVSFQIADTGVGIPKENLGKLFEPFFTTKKKGKGVGLGLSVAYGIVQEHGGTIQVTSEPDKGSVFHVEIPVGGSSQLNQPQGGTHGRD